MRVVKSTTYLGVNVRCFLLAAGRATGKFRQTRDRTYN